MDQQSEIYIISFCNNFIFYFYFCGMLPSDPPNFIKLFCTRVKIFTQFLPTYGPLPVPKWTVLSSDYIKWTSVEKIKTGYSLKDTLRVYGR
jgi:hypothetical protein